MKTLILAIFPRGANNGDAMRKQNQGTDGGLMPIPAFHKSSKVTPSNPGVRQQSNVRVKKANS